MRSESEDLAHHPHRRHKHVRRVGEEGLEPGHDGIANDLLDGLAEKLGCHPGELNPDVYVRAARPSWREADPLLVSNTDAMTHPGHFVKRLTHRQDLLNCHGPGLEQIHLKAAPGHPGLALHPAYVAIDSVPRPPALPV